MNYWVCPSNSNCGSSFNLKADMSGEWQIFKNVEGETVDGVFNNQQCNYLISFPDGATHGSIIKARVATTSNAKINMYASESYKPRQGEVKFSMAK